MKIIFIRHGKTRGNLEKRYIGRTDEPLCAEGIDGIRRTYPVSDIVICSPMKRCRETAEIIYPDRKAVIYSGLRECDFGDFEGKNYTELSKDRDYRDWLDRRGEMPFPHGESRRDFAKRCTDAFMQAVCEIKCGTAAFIVHGGTIMAILEKYAVPKKSFYDYQTENGCGFITEFDGKNIRITEEIT